MNYKTQSRGNQGGARPQGGPGTGAKGGSLSVFRADESRRVPRVSSWLL